MKTKEELNALKAEVEAVRKKLAELSKEELEQVCGGFTQNSDGTYNIYAFEVFRSGSHVFTTAETKLNATLDTCIVCEYFIEDENGMLIDCGMTEHPVGKLLKYNE